MKIEALKCSCGRIGLALDNERVTPHKCDGTWEVVATVERELLPLAGLADLEGDEEPVGHVDEFIWRPEFVADDNLAYARWMLMHFRLPAHAQLQWERFMRDRRLFCTHEGLRYRVTGASRMGDVWLATDHARDTGYDKRVMVAECSAWGAEP